MRKLLWIGDAACPSGFAKCTHETIPGLIRAGWEMHVLGLNYRGDPHAYPYPIYPAHIGGDLFGVKRMLEMIERVRPEMVVIQNDPWNIPAYTRELSKLKTPPPAVGTIAIDGKNAQGKSLNGLTRALFWTTFAQREAIKGGMTIPSGVVPLGIDLNVYTPGSRTDARDRLGLAGYRDAFVVLNVNRNQPRKHLDLTIEYFAEWIKSRNVEDAFLYLHVCPTGERHVDCEQLAEYYGIAEKVFLVEPKTFVGIAERHVVTTYQSANVYLSTTQGEGWGLPAMEAMACGVPCVLPDWSAYGEWARGAAFLVPCTQNVLTPRVNVIGGLPNKEATVEALDALYRSRELRHNTRKAGLEFVKADCFKWSNIADQFAAEVELAVKPDFVYG